MRFQASGRTGSNGKIDNGAERIEGTDDSPVTIEADTPRIRIGMLWHSVNSGNLGVGALTIANVALAGEVARDMGLNPQFVIMQMRDSGKDRIDLPASEVVAIDGRAITRRNGFWRAVGDVDCVLDIGAGDSFADIYGPRRFFFLWITKLMATMRGTPLVLSPQTIGPFTKPGYRLLASMAMKRCEIVVARDAISRDIAARMAPNVPAMTATDVAFVLPYRDQSALRHGAKLRIGVNASGLLFHEAETRRNRFGLSYDYAAFTSALLASLSARPDTELYLIPHATSDGDSGDDDGQLADRLTREFPLASRVPNFADACEAKSFISSLDLLVAGRMHACIAAFSSGTPVVPVAYSRKFSGVFESLGYDEVLPVTGLDVDGALQFVLCAIDRRQVLADKLARGMDAVESLIGIYRKALRHTFTKALERRR
jgi:colanic acid/amylovoran biosynthesis protein